MYHALYHWRYALNQTVLDWLKINGHLTPTMIVERESLRRKKREKSANKIVDGMVENGIMQELYKQFKENLEIARSTKVIDLTKFSKSWSAETMFSPNVLPRIVNSFGRLVACKVFWRLCCIIVR